MPKKQPKNAFYFFMVDVQDDYRRRGEMYSMKDIATIAGPQWRQLSAERKKYYENIAKEEKGRNRSGKLDSYGNSIDEIQRLEQEQIEEERQMENNIEMQIKYLGDKEEVANQSFFFISTKIFCITDEGEYLPAELGLIEYSLADGIIRQYHVFIDPGSLPLGYFYTCKETSDRTHKIPPQGFEHADNKYDIMALKIKDMLNPENTNDDFPPLYCSRDEMDQTKYILKWLQLKSGVRNRINYRVYDYAVLMFKLYQFSSTQMCSVALVRDYLSSSHFTYNANTCCEWHWAEDSPEHCALGTVKRVGYIFSDHLCENFNITPLPNKHLPEKEPDEPLELPPPVTRIEKRSVSYSSSKPSTPSFDREMSSIVTNIKSSFNLEEDKYYVPSASAGVPTGKETLVKKPVPRTLEPLREPKPQTLSFSDVSHPYPVRQFKLEESDFPELGDDVRSESSMSLSSFGARSTVSKSSVSTFSTPNSWVRPPVAPLSSQRPPQQLPSSSAVSFQRPPVLGNPRYSLPAERLPRVGQPSTQNAVPIGRGIGRGLPVQK